MHHLLISAQCVCRILEGGKNKAPLSLTNLQTRVRVLQSNIEGLPFSKPRKLNLTHCGCSTHTVPIPISLCKMCPLDSFPLKAVARAGITTILRMHDSAAFWFPGIGDEAGRMCGDETGGKLSGREGIAHQCVCVLKL